MAPMLLASRAHVSILVGGHSAPDDLVQWGWHLEEKHRIFAAGHQRWPAGDGSGWLHSSDDRLRRCEWSCCALDTQAQDPTCASWGRRREFHEDFPDQCRLLVGLSSLRKFIGLGFVLD